MYVPNVEELNRDILDEAHISLMQCILEYQDVSYHLTLLLLAKCEKRDCRVCHSLSNLLVG